MLPSEYVTKLIKKFKKSKEFEKLYNLRKWRAGFVNYSV